MIFLDLAGKVSFCSALRETAATKTFGSGASSLHVMFLHGYISHAGWDRSIHTRWLGILLLLWRKTCFACALSYANPRNCSIWDYQKTVRERRNSVVILWEKEMAGAIRKEILESSQNVMTPLKPEHMHQGFSKLTEWGPNVAEQRQGESGRQAGPSHICQAISSEALPNGFLSLIFLQLLIAFSDRALTSEMEKEEKKSVCYMFFL